MQSVGMSHKTACKVEAEQERSYVLSDKINIQIKQNDLGPAPGRSGLS